MRFRIFIVGFYMAMTAVMSCGHKEKAKAIFERPNIVWIIAEDMSQDLACYGNGLIKTPALDALAKRGIRYENAFSNGPACSPSRTALITGHYQNSLGARHMRYPDSLKPALPNGVEPMHVVLKRSGYQTANIISKPGTGKTDWLFDYDPKTYDKYHWDELDKESPFFARISLSLTHRGFSKDNKNPINPDKISVPPYYPDHTVSREDWTGYYESIQKLDEQIAGILNDLKVKKLLDNTLIFFFSDHGRPMIRAKNFLYESGLKIPLIISSFDDNVRKTLLHERGVDSQLVSLIDVTASTLNLAEADNYDVQGTPFLGTGSEIHKRFVYGAVDRIGNVHFKSRTVRGKRYRYIRNYNTNVSVNSGTTAYRRANHPMYHLLNILNDRKELNDHQSRLVEPMVYEELYDVINDPYELNNLALKPGREITLQEMRENLDHWMHDIDDKGFLEDSQEIVRAFEDYGETTFKRNSGAIEKLRNQVLNDVERAKVNSIRNTVSRRD